MPFFLGGMCFSLFLTEPRGSQWTSFLSLPLGAQGHTGPVSLPSLLHWGRLVETPVVTCWRQFQGCARWIKKRPLVAFTFQEAKCFSNQKQKDLAQAGQTLISVKEGATQLSLSPPDPDVFPTASYLPPCHMVSLPFLIFLETLWLALLSLHPECDWGWRQAKQRAPVSEKPGSFSLRGCVSGLLPSGSGCFPCLCA